MINFAEVTFPKADKHRDDIFECEMYELMRISLCPAGTRILCEDRTLDDAVSLVIRCFSSGVGAESISPRISGRPSSNRIGIVSR
jgi:hypothetical protein